MNETEYSGGKIINLDSKAKIITCHYYSHELFLVTFNIREVTLKRNSFTKEESEVSGDNLFFWGFFLIKSPLTLREACEKELVRK